MAEDRWAELGPQGAIGCCSSLVYWNPGVLLRCWEHLHGGDWANLQSDCRKMSALFAGLFAEFGPRGFTDTAYDRLGGLAGGFLRTSLRNRGPYASPAADDVTRCAACSSSIFQSCSRCARLIHSPKNVVRAKRGLARLPPGKLCGRQLVEQFTIG